MILYTKDLKQIEFEDKPIMDEGSCGYIYRYNDKVLKIYKDFCFFSYKLKRNKFELLKKINAPSLPKLDEYFFEFKLGSLIYSRVSAYTMNYIERNEFNILTMDKKELYSIIERLDYTIKLLSDYNIILKDIKLRNSIPNINGIDLIDVDLYCKRVFYHKLYNVSSYNLNKSQLIALLNEYIYYTANKYKLLNYLDALLFIKYDSNLSLTECVINSLSEDNILNSLMSKYEKKKIR